MYFKVDESKPLGLSTLIVFGDYSTCNLSKLLKHLLQLLIGNRFIQVFDVDISPFLFNLIGRSLFARLEGAHVAFLAVEKLAIYFGNCIVSCFFAVVVNESISFGIAVFVRCYFARENIPKRRESIVECFVVNRLVEVLDEDVSLIRSSHGRISLRPHNSTGSAFDLLVVQEINSTFRCGVEGNKVKGEEILALRVLMGEDIDRQFAIKTKLSG